MHVPVEYCARGFLAGLPAADDVLNLVILDVDDDDLDDDCGVAGAESSPPSFAAVTTGATTVQDSTRRRSSATVSTEIVSKMTEFAREGRETTCPTGAAAAYPGTHALHRSATEGVETGNAIPSSQGAVKVDACVRVYVKEALYRRRSPVSH